MIASQSIKPSILVIHPEKIKKRKKKENKTKAVKTDTTPC